MAAGKINLQANDGSVIGLVMPDGLVSGERQISLGTNLSSVTSYHLLQGNLAVSNSTITKGFDTKLYTSGSATTGIDMSTQWGSTAEEKYGGLIWLKDRVEATNNFLYDTIRGTTKEINSNTKEAEATLAGGLTAFNSTGFTVGADTGHNSTTNNMVSWNFQTTHRVSGTTNHGKAYTCHYNPFTGFTIVKYEGSGIAGHEIPHHLGRKLGFVVTKNTSIISDWVTFDYNGNSMYLNRTDANSVANFSLMDNVCVWSTYYEATNRPSEPHIMYGWANSYFDESDKLIGNYELVTYQGTGAAGNKVKTRGKPAWVMVKRVDVASDWFMFDNQRDTDSLKDHYLIANLSIVESVSTTFGYNFIEDGLICNDANAANNAAGGQYIALVAYDTNSNGGGSYYPLASDTANVQVNSALIPLAKGIDGNGVKNSIVVANETITGITYTAGKNYLYKTDSSYGVKPYEPRYLKSELVRRFAGEQPDYFDVESNKWFNTDAGSELVTNGKFAVNTSGWTAVNATLSVASGGLSVYCTASYGNAYQLINTTIGKAYRIKGQINTNIGALAWVQAETALGLFNLLNYGTTTTGNFDLTFVAQTTTTYIKLQSGASAGNSAIFDNISVFPIDITPTTEITESRNYMNHIVHADNDGGVLYVEELPKIEYKDIVKANEYKGKNACIALVRLNTATTPMTIRNSFGVSSVIRLSAGVYDIYLNDEVDLNEVVISGSTTFLGASVTPDLASSNNKKIRIITYRSDHLANFAGGDGELSVKIYGGRN